MTQILAFIVSHMGFLWANARYRITGSEIETTNGGDALVLVESKELRFRFVLDRGQLFLDLQPASAGPDLEWYSIDLVRRLNTGQPEKSAELDEGFAAFVHDNLSEIERQFGTEEWPKTIASLRMLKARRAKELFG